MSEKANANRRTCFGTGLIALDLVTNSNHANESLHQAWAGGSCGNVLTILSYLGWNSHPIARIGSDLASKVIAEDMISHGVNFHYVLFDELVHTPIVVQKIFIAKNGNLTHRFYWNCPNCGSSLPRYKPIRLKDVRNICEQTPSMDCFYFDRVSPAALRLAEIAKQKGVLIVFEPTKIKHDSAFLRAMELCDILKYSNERVKNSPKLVYESKATLVIETLGAEGLKFRLRKKDKCGQWKQIPSFNVRNLNDTAGAGDWCTAGLIHMITAKGPPPLKKMSEKQIKDSLKYGQALSALNCNFKGARGAMYGIQKSRFEEEVRHVLFNKETSTVNKDFFRSKTKKSSECICPTCQTQNNINGKRALITQELVIVK